MSVEIIHQSTNTLPSGFKITFTVGRVSKAGSPSRGAVAPSSSGIEPGPANQFISPNPSPSTGDGQ